MTRSILQISDLHLVADPAERSKNVPTNEAFQDVLDYLDSCHDPFDIIVLTGDLAQDEKRETYENLRAMLSSRLDRCLLLPGNHDNREFLGAVFPDAAQDPKLERIVFSVEYEGWRLIGLDTHFPGHVKGRLGAEQLAWLEDEMAADRQQPTILFMHHPPISVGCTWLETIGLEDAVDLAQLVTSAPQVQLICAGHVHHEFQGKLGSADVLTTPSTAIQFSPFSDKPRFDLIAPGFRTISLEGTTFRSEVVRLPSLKHVPVSKEE